MVNWRENPMVRLLAGLLPGIIAAWQGWPCFQIAWYVLVFSGIILLFLTITRIPFRGRHLFGITLFIFLTCLGFLRAFYWEVQGGKDSLPSPGPAVLEIIGEPISRGDWQRASCLVFPGKTPGYKHENPAFRAHVFLESADSCNRLQVGDILFVRANWQIPDSAVVPYSFDNRAFLRKKNIHFQTFIRKDDWKKASISVQSIQRTALRLRQKLVSCLEVYLGSPAAIDIVAALVLGDRSDLDPELKAAYAETGAIHVLAVSGLHVGLLLVLFQHFLRVTQLQKHLPSVVSAFLQISFIWGFAFITGGAPSVLRASTMFSFVIAGKALNRSANIYNTLAASAFFLVWIHPYILFETGFQLSYLAVLGIVFFQHRVYSCWVPENDLANKLWTLISVGVAAQLTTTPVSIYLFHQFPVYFWLSGLVVVPAASLVLSATLLLFGLSSTLPCVAHLLGYFITACVQGMNLAIQFIAQLPGSLIKGIFIDEMALFGLYAALALLMRALVLKRGGALLPVLFILVGLATYRVAYLVTCFRQEAFHLYSTRNGYLVDFYAGRKAYVFRSSGISDKEEQYLTSGVRLANGITDYVPFQDSSKIVAPGFSYANGIVSLGKKRVVAFAPPNWDFQNVIGLKLSHLLIDGAFRAEFNRLDSATYKDMMLIVLPSTSFQKGKFSQWCQISGLSCEFVSRKDFKRY